MSDFTEKEKEYIKENRLKESMNAISRNLGCSYTKVRSYMIKNNLQVDKKISSKFKKDPVNNNPYRFY